MKLPRRLAKFLSLSPYEAANPSPRRGRVPGATPTDAKKELTASTRRELVRKSRYLHKNSGFARELVGDMAIYSMGEGIKPQAQSDDAAWNRLAEAHFARWCLRADITGRFSFEQCQGLVCRGVDIDGEYFVVKVRDRFGLPRVQLVESHRVGDTALSEETVDGIGFDRYGAPAFYRIQQDDKSWRDVPAGAVMHIFEPENASAARCAPTLQHSIHHLLDEMELLALEKHAVKDNADISRVLTRESGELDEDGDFVVKTDSALDDGSDPQQVQRIIGGKIVAIKPGESLESFAPNRPSPVFTGFLEHLKRDSSAGILPYEFVAGLRQDRRRGRAAGGRQGRPALRLSQAHPDSTPAAPDLGLGDRRRHRPRRSRARQGLEPRALRHAPAHHSRCRVRGAAKSRRCGNRPEDA